MKLGGFTSPQARVEYDAAYDRGFAALPAPTGRHDVPTQFGTARVYRFGEPGPAPAVLLPGRAGTTIMWEPNLPALVDRGPVYTVDLIGEPGRSEQTAPIRNAADQAAWLDTVLTTLDLRDVHLVGYSFGGWLATNLAVRAPDRLASLTLIDPVQTFAMFPVSLLARTALTLMPGIRRWARTSFLSWVADGAEVDEADPVASVIDEGMRTYRITLPTPVLFTDAQLRGLSVPVLALIAGRSVIHGAQRAFARARKLLPDAQVELWPTATHAIAGESPAEVNARVRQFLAEIEQRGEVRR
ncbi:alpha/beta fold hydrolase [Kibdelosporangium phytohabitans]|uniref:Menaquinone biosynthesis protein n=1 Tax=Kibdelosporangium phytohabitans TaxID=860235 RepID=A0A0N9I562_9PSEU|nr:alpha/beta hydrolase [Kibdelosporangium phytohabitans]ALG09985.1 menaquinone biosynthesis protein [Kibdelosporangium phytohabitans]MBE1468598.1 pimeloyl-ACP methyl ester carboxylesterase [Kibdelosporangium phytohabitans]